MIVRMASWELAKTTRLARTDSQIEILRNSLPNSVSLFKLRQTPYGKQDEFSSSRHEHGQLSGQDITAFKTKKISTLEICRSGWTNVEKMTSVLAESVLCQETLCKGMIAKWSMLRFWADLANRFRMRQCDIMTLQDCFSYTTHRVLAVDCQLMSPISVSSIH